MEFERMHPADQLVEMMNRIYRCGMTTTSGGNLSIRDENGDIWITPSGVDKGSLTREDIMQVKPDGSYIGKHKPSVEYPFHRDIYRSRPDINGVVHAHPPVMVGFSLARVVPETRLLPETYLACGDVERVPYNAPGTHELDVNISEKFARGCNTVLMENHGVVCGAKNLWEAFVAFETITLGGQTQLNALKLGEPRRLRREQITRAAAENKLPPARENMPAVEGEGILREQLCSFARRFWERKLVASTVGSISVRLADGSMLITPARGDMSNLRPEQVVRVKDGFAEAAKDAGEAASLHAKIYAAHPDVAAAVVSHAPNIMGYAVTGKKFDSYMISEGYIILGDVQRLECETGALDEDRIVEMLGRRKSAVVVDNRCAVVTGASLINAFDRTEVLEYGAASVLCALGVGRPVTLTQEEIQGTDEALGI